MYCFISFEVFFCGTGYLYKPEGRRQKRVGKFEFEREGSAHRSVRDRAWLALRLVGAGARERVPGTRWRALRAQGLHAQSHCAWWVLGHARVSPAHTLCVVARCWGKRTCSRHWGTRARVLCVRKGCTRVRCQRKHCLLCDGDAVCPEFDTRLLGITAGMRPSRKGSGAKAAKSTRVVR
jgi:hypothetical protein